VKKYVIHRSCWEHIGQPMDWEGLTKIEGPIPRHIEQLWDEVKKLKEKISKLEKEKNV
jgi:hypothetical protein